MAAYAAGMDLPAALTPLDLAALGLLALSAVGLGWLIDHPPARRLSVTVLMARYRQEWMKQFVTRAPRIFDANVLDSLRQGTAFFASACMIILGGGIAVIGNSERLTSVAAELPLAAETQILELRIVLVLVFVANGLLKFIWAHRLFGYCAILMAAVPNDPDHPEAYTLAARAGEINITAARAFNRGLRSVYFALGALGWLLGPEALIATTLLTVGVLARREFASESRRIILRTPK